MAHEPTEDPDLQESFRTAVHHGRFATYDEAEADFWVRLDEAIAEADRGEFVNVEAVRGSLRERFANWSRAAE